MLANKESALDAKRLKELFDLRSDVYETRGGSFEGDPYPAFNRLRGTGRAARSMKRLKKRGAASLVISTFQ